MPHQSDRQGEQKIRLLTFNIQAGTSTARYHHYVTHSWRQVLPHTQRVENLDAIAAFASSFDMVALQEVDSGSLRSGYINQSRYLANHAGMPFWCHQSNRRVGKVKALALSSNTGESARSTLADMRCFSG